MKRKTCTWRIYLRVSYSYEVTSGCFISCLHYFTEQDVTYLFVVFRKDTRPAITKVPANCRNLSSPMRRSMAVCRTNSGGTLRIIFLLDQSILKRKAHIPNSESLLVEWRGDTSVYVVIHVLRYRLRYITFGYVLRYILRNICEIYIRTYLITYMSLIVCLDKDHLFTRLVIFFILVSLFLSLFFF